MNHCELCWDSGCESWCAMISKCVWFWANDCASLWVMLKQWLWITLWYAEPVVLKDHGVLYWASGCQSWWDMLSYWLLFMVSYAEPVVVTHDEAWLASVCISWCVMLCQWMWIMVCYAEPVAVNHDVLGKANGCESCCAMLSHFEINSGIGLERSFTTKDMISIFPLQTFHLYVATFQQHLHMEYISLRWYDIPELVVPIRISLIEGCC